MQSATPPLILTLKLDEPTFRFFNTLRERHFPPERNFLKAHLTLFHHLPDTEEIRQTTAEVAGTTACPMVLEITGLIKLGGGVAYRLHCDALMHLHRKLQQLWQPYLTRQDQQPLRPHITVQNKVTAAQALELYQQLSGDFRPFAGQGLGLDLFAYLQGPWRREAAYDFGNGSKRECESLPE